MLLTASVIKPTDMFQDWAGYLLGASGYGAYSSYIYQFYSALNTIKSWLLPLIDQVVRKPDLATIALLLIIVLVSLKIVNMLMQTVLFWFRLAKTVLFWGGLAALGVWMWSRGPAGMVEDVQYWQGTWKNEYAHEKETVAKLARQGAQYGRQQARQGGWF